MNWDAIVVGGAFTVCLYFAWDIWRMNKSLKHLADELRTVAEEYEKSDKSDAAKKKASDQIEAISEKYKLP